TRAICLLFSVGRPGVGSLVTGFGRCVSVWMAWVAVRTVAGPDRSVRSSDRRVVPASSELGGGPCDAHSLSPRGARLLGSALAPLLGPRPVGSPAARWFRGPATLVRCRLAVWRTSAGHLRRLI